MNPKNSTAFEVTRKRRKGFPSETGVKRGLRTVHNDKELIEKLGRNDLCPCGSGRRFQELLLARRKVRWREAKLLLSENDLAWLWLVLAENRVLPNTQSHPAIRIKST
ncbi:MAG: SEC-C domain-containing protein [Acidobacteria bacterium]|nr:SEC-C domain-containing protein [Acidobacteriota bacterium]MCI0621313.1 SEC-C domain-containing protein [Acidobacteriota bacterium]MCI0724865.1 SEC-C domain-containing protein [Acidobacteriota bacterium]